MNSAISLLVAGVADVLELSDKFVKMIHDSADEEYRVTVLKSMYKMTLFSLCLNPRQTPRQKMVFDVKYLIFLSSLLYLSAGEPQTQPTYNSGRDESSVRSRPAASSSSKQTCVRSFYRTVLSPQVLLAAPTRPELEPRHGDVEALHGGGREAGRAGLYLYQGQARQPRGQHQDEGRSSRLHRSRLSEGQVIRPLPLPL